MSLWKRLFSRRPSWIPAAWPRGPWDDEDDRRYAFVEAGYECELWRDPRGVWNGQVILPSTHPWSRLRNPYDLLRSPTLSPDTPISRILHAGNGLALQVQYPNSAMPKYGLRPGERYVTMQEAYNDTRTIAWAAKDAEEFGAPGALARRHEL